VNKTVDKVSSNEVKADGKTFSFDKVISTLPSFALERLIDFDIPKVEHNTLLTINFGYNEPLNI
jgi:hypothetical protein